MQLHFLRKQYVLLSVLKPPCVLGKLQIKNIAFVIKNLSPFINSYHQFFCVIEYTDHQTKASQQLKVTKKNEFASSVISDDGVYNFPMHPKLNNYMEISLCHIQVPQDSDERRQFDSHNIQEVIYSVKINISNKEFIEETWCPTTWTRPFASLNKEDLNIKFEPCI